MDTFAPKFPRVKCAVCGTLCLPEHAPQYRVRMKDRNGEADYKLVRLCRVPTSALADGGLGFTGCGVNAGTSCKGEALLLADPYLGQRAPAPLSL